MTRYSWMIGICLVFGCTSSTEKNVLPKEQMTKVLWDMVQVDELATLRSSRDTGKDSKKERIQLYQKVFQLHNISKDQFAKSFKWYSVHPDLIKELFDSLDARGARERKNSYTHKDSLIKTK